MSQSPLIVGLVSDIFFTVQISQVIQALGYRVQWIERGDQLKATGLIPAPRRPGEPLTGQSAAFIAQIVDWQPALLIVELNSQPIPWAVWIAALKSSSATRRIPVLAFGPHTDLALRQQAEDVGCDAVVAKGRFVSDLPSLIEKHIRHTPYDCSGSLSTLARQGIELFNRQEFFEAHEELEHAWNAEAGPGRELYRGILQVAVAYLQISRRNYNGALKMFLRLRQWLDPLPDVCRGVNVAQLRADALAARTELERLGPERIAEFNVQLLKPVMLQLQ